MSAHSVAMPGQQQTNTAAQDVTMTQASSTPTARADAPSASVQGTPADAPASAAAASASASLMDLSTTAAAAPASSSSSYDVAANNDSGSKPSSSTAGSSSSASGSSASAAASSSSSAAAASSHPSTSAPAAAPSSSSSSSSSAAAAAAGNRAPGDRMIIKLTTHLMNTYNAINEKYYANKRLRLLEQEQQQKAMRAKAQALAQQGSAAAAHAHTVYNDGHDDKEFNYIVQAHELLAQRYVVDHSIGKGSFGRVVKAFDTQSKRYVAIKIVKSKSAFYKQAQIELKLLMSLQAEADKWNIVTVVDHFLHKNHQCIVFELLSLNLYELLRNTRFTGVSLKLIAKFGQQLLVTLGHLNSKERGDKRIIHCDLKPENILLRSCKKSAIKVIDFGSACFANQKTYTYIQSRFYRAPEVLLGLPYNGAIDMWSLGCILVEMHTGKPLFDGQDEADQMVKQVEILGVPPRHMLERNRKADKFFEVSESTGQYRLKRKFPQELGYSLRRAMRSKWDETNELYIHFEDLISQMLLYDPALRIRPKAALNHPFFGAVAESIKAGATDAAAAASASGAKLSAASGNPAGTGSGVATSADAFMASASPAAAPSSATSMDTSSPRSQAAAGQGAAPAAAAAAPAAAPSSKQDEELLHAHKLALLQQQHLSQLHQHHYAAANFNPRKRPHSNPLFGGNGGAGGGHPHIHFGIPTQHGIQPLDPHVQQAIANQSRQAAKQTRERRQQGEQPPAAKQQTLMEDGAAAAAASSATAAASSDEPVKPASHSSDAALASSSGSQMEDALQPDQSSTLVAAANPQTPARAHGMTTRSAARSGGGTDAPPSSASSSSAALSVKRDILDAAHVEHTPAAALPSSARSSRRASPTEADADADARAQAAAASSLHVAAAPAESTRSRGNSQLAGPPRTLLGDASTVTTAAASATSSPRHQLPAAPFLSTSLALPDAASTTANSSAPASSSSSSSSTAASAASSMVDAADEPPASESSGSGSARQSPVGDKKAAGSGGGSSGGKRGKRGKKASAAAVAANTAAAVDSESEGGASSSQLSRMSLNREQSAGAPAPAVSHRTRSQVNH